VCNSEMTELFDTGLFEHLGTVDLPVSWDGSQPFVLYRVKQSPEDRNEWMKQRMVQPYAYDKELALRPRTSFKRTLGALSATLQTLWGRVGLLPLIDELDGAEPRTGSTVDASDGIGNAITAAIGDYKKMRNIAGDSVKTAEDETAQILRDKCTNSMAYLHKNRYSHQKFEDKVSELLKSTKGLSSCFDLLDTSQENTPRAYTAFVDEASSTRE
jgi:hypothetical protein